jgi:hypothetical protein
MCMLELFRAAIVKLIFLKSSLRVRKRQELVSTIFGSRDKIKVLNTLYLSG